MTRYSSGSMIYNFEFVLLIIFTLISVYLWKKRDDKSSFLVFIIAGSLESCIELIAQGFGVRIITETYLFNVFYVGYPFLPFILGFYEGGVFCLLSYQFVKYMLLKNKFSGILFGASTATITFFTFIGAMMMRLSINAGDTAINLTRRNVFNPGTTLILIVCYCITFGYLFINKNVLKKDWSGLFYWYLGIVILYGLVFVSLNIFMIRYIEIMEGSMYVTASFYEQLLVLYGYGLALEPTGFFLPLYIIIHRFKLLPFNDKSEEFYEKIT